MDAPSQLALTLRNVLPPFAFVGVLFAAACLGIWFVLPRNIRGRLRSLHPLPLIAAMVLFGTVLPAYEDGYALFLYTFLYVVVLACVGVGIVVRLARQVKATWMDVWLPLCFFGGIVLFVLGCALWPLIFPPGMRGAPRHVPQLKLTHWSGQELVYRRPEPETQNVEVIAYYWPPVRGAKGIWTLCRDGLVAWVNLNEERELINLRTGEVVARAPTVRAKTAPR
jgi:hypothetical protein